ncbi:unnamed protein product, partial [Ectocarpus sp. 8 AP-2014]
ATAAPPPAARRPRAGAAAAAHGRRAHGLEPDLGQRRRRPAVEVNVVRGPREDGDRVPVRRNRHVVGGHDGRRRGGRRRLARASRNPHEGRRTALPAAVHIHVALSAP